MVIFKRIGALLWLTLAAALVQLARGGVRKVLLFVRSRAEVDVLSEFLKGSTPWGSRVLAHHGSLSREARESTERLVRELQSAVVVSTSTLEMGVDIGSMDYVLLADRPPSVQSLLQRVGRSGRRGGVPRFGYVLRDRADAIYYEVMLRHAASGDLLADPCRPRTSVILQQALVLAGGAERVTPGVLESALPADLFPGRKELLAILRAGAGAGWLEQVGKEHFVLGPRGERKWDSGRVHANLDEPRAMEVLDEATGQVVARVSRDQELGTGSRLVIGGRSWEVRMVDAGGRAQVVASTDQRGRKLRYPVGNRPHLGLAMARAVAARLGAGPRELVLGRWRGRWFLLHGLGTPGARYLARLLELQGLRALPQIEGWRPPVVLQVEPPAGMNDQEVYQAARRALRGVPGPSDWLAERGGAQERLVALRVGMGPYHRFLPLEQRVEATLRVACLDLALSLLQGARLRDAGSHGTDPPAAWTALAGRFD